MKNFIVPIPLTSVTSSSINNTTYTAINDAGLPHACSIVRIINASSTAVQISYNGTTDHDYVAAGGTIQLDLQTNRQPNGQVALLRAGTVIYVKGTAGTGFLGLAAYYQEV